MQVADTELTLGVCLEGQEHVWGAGAAPSAVLFEWKRARAVCEMLWLIATMQLDHCDIST
jgi:hypothetical protein